MECNYFTCGGVRGGVRPLVYNACVDKKMAVILCHLLLTLLLSGQGLCQCYSQSSCAGDVVSSSDQRDCCVDQFGSSYNDTGTCRPCIGFIMIVNT